MAPELVSKGRVWGFRIDPYLTLFFFVFFIISIFLIYNPNSSLELYKRQALNYGISLIFFVIISQIPSNFVKLLAPYLYLLGIIMLVIVLLFGVEGKGAQRWIDFGILNIQPSEFFKFLLPLMLAWWFNLADDNGFNKWLNWIVVAIFIITAVLMIAVQPDLGSALMVLVSGLIVIFLVGLPWKVIIISMACMALSFPILWSNMYSYQKQRVLTFLDPYKDPLGFGYHVIQSTIAIGSGGLFGRGWLQGSQSRLDFVPEQHTDFIFSIVAEEYGFIGGTALILLYVALMWRGLIISLNSQTHFLRILGVALSVVIFFYVGVNIAMVTGLLPVVGLPLPLISYGGSSLITYAIILGILSSIKCHSPDTAKIKY